MPNWVFNTLNNYPKEIYDKYKSEDRDIDFNKIIPEPQEVADAPSTSFNNIAKCIHQYNKLIKETPENEIKYKVESHSENPLMKPLKQIAENTVMQMGHLAIKSPDESLNEILSNKPNYSNMYNEYVGTFGNVKYETYNKETFDKFIDVKEKSFKDFRKSTESAGEYKIKQESLDELGEHLLKVQDKYGFDNWYDWRVANWGTKWNAVDPNYDEEYESMHFDTAWSIPYPLIAKIADDNPEVKLDGYSEEETGWFEEYKTDNRKLTITGSGELQYDEETDETKEVRDAFTPVTYTYAQVAKDSIDHWKNVKINTSKYF